MTFVFYILGALLVGAGICYGLFLLGVSEIWIGVAALIILGAGIMGAATRSRSSRVAPPRGY